MLWECVSDLKPGSLGSNKDTAKVFSANLGVGRKGRPNHALVHAVLPLAACGRFFRIGRLKIESAIAFDKEQALRR